jgi:hypothetical protein
MLARAPWHLNDQTAVKTVYGFVESAAILFDSAIDRHALA